MLDVRARFGDTLRRVSNCTSSFAT
jgi:hypothetical protein